MSGARWAEHDRAWRRPDEVIAGVPELPPVEAAAARGRARGEFWEVLDRLGICVLVSREYEHFVIALAVQDGRPRVSTLPVPHPSGIAVDRATGTTHIALTRNPNQILELAPVVAIPPRADRPTADATDRPLVPVGTRYLPGSLYLHELALVGGELHGNAVGENAVVRFAGARGYERVWWPRSIEAGGRPDFSRNLLQLNSIAAGAGLEDSFFTASAAKPGGLRPGHVRWAVDRRGVVFSGRTREPVAGGLTRPHSARLHQGEAWVLDSGYGRFGVCRDGRFEEVAGLPGWTRGLAICGEVALIATSRVIPRFHRYAPGLDVRRSVCGLHAWDLVTGRLLGSLHWPAGNQVFAVEWLPRTATLGFPNKVGERSRNRSSRLFYSYATAPSEDNKR